MVEIIGAGEVTCFKILKRHYGDDVIIKKQVQLSTLLNDDFMRTISDRQKKETIDMVVYIKKRLIAVRVQDRHHCTKKMSNIDQAQARILNWCGVDVLDLYHYDCEGMFKDDYELGYNEVIQCMKDQNIK